MVDFSPLSTLKRMATGGAAAPMPASVGRFELQSLLGQGAQAQVWLAFDPRLERQVAIKLMKPVEGPDTAALAQWLQEARSVSRVTHPNIVPVYEADVQAQQAYLVFEYVPGQTLAQTLTAQGARPALQAVALMQEVLGALVAAHSAGVVHRDLKPSNVLMDANGRARVMDFGIAARTNAATTDEAGDIAGSPAYMAPEAIRGEAASPLMDVYSAGLMLAELLWGKPVRQGGDLKRLLDKAASEPLQWPSELLARLDDPLRAILLRATAFDAGQRYPDAQGFLDALRQWADNNQLAQPVGDSAKAGSQSGTLEFLLRRMRNKSDFPALSESIGRIQSMASSDKESVSSVTNEILKDVALTNKLLRVVNSAHYARGDSIGTISRAVSLVGFNGIRNMALSLVLLEHMQDKGNAQLLKEEFLRALMAGSIAAELGGTTAEGEEAFIGALFQNLGRMLSQFYFPEEAASVRALASDPREPVPEEAAATRALGLSYESLGLGVAKAWGLPESIQRCIVKPAGDPPNRVPSDPQHRQRWSARAANEMADAMLHDDPKAVDAHLVQTAKRYARALGVSTEHIQAATVVARKKLVELADAMEISVRPDSRASRLLTVAGNATDLHTQTVHTASDFQDTLARTELQATQVMPASPSASTAATAESAARVVPVAHIAQTLTAGIQDITNAMVEDFKLSDVLRMVLEAMFRAFDFHRIIFCMRDVKTDTLTGRFGLGAGVEGVVKTFCVPMNAPGKPDLFVTICHKGADTLISDSRDPRIEERLPAWYKKTYHAPTFLILPLQLKGKPFGMIYADKAELGELVVDERELAMLRTLRNQAVMAFRQST